MPTPLHDAHPIVATVRQFVDKEVVPAASSLEHADAYPHDLVARMRDMGLFGALVPKQYDGLGLDVATYARIIEEIEASVGRPVITSNQTVIWDALGRLGWTSRPGLSGRLFASARFETAPVLQRG